MMFRLLLVVLVAACAVPRAWAREDAAALVPADAGVFIELHDLGALRRHWNDDPIMRRIAEHLPARRNPDAWQFVQMALGMTSEQLIDTYFNQRIVLVAERPGEEEPAVVMTRIDPADGVKLVEGLLLMKTASVNGFDLYEPEDRGSRIALGGDWLLFADQWHEPFLLRVIESIGGDQQLDGDADYQRWTAQLPAERQAGAFLRDEEGMHALALVSRDDGFTVHYAGTSDRFAPMLDRLGDATQLRPVPAPADAAFVVAMNFRGPEPEHEAFLDRLLAPYTVAGDLRQAVSAPLVVWADARAADEDVPAMTMGAAVHLEDRSGAKMMDLALDRALVLVNIATLKQEMPPLTVTAKETAGRSYRTIEVGEALRGRVSWPAITEATLTYGAVGDWYVAATHEQAFLDVAEPPAAAVREPGAEARRPIAALWCRPRQIAGRLAQVRQVLESRGIDPAPRARRVFEAIPLLESYETIHLSLEAGDGGAIHGRLDVTR